MLGMPKAPRVFFLAIFPVTTFILYCTYVGSLPFILSDGLSHRMLTNCHSVILELGCINDTMSVVSPIIVRSNGSVLIGAQTTAPIDLRIGFWGKNGTPAAIYYTSSYHPQTPRLTRLTEKKKRHLLRTAAIHMHQQPRGIPIQIRRRAHKGDPGKPRRRQRDACPARTRPPGQLCHP